MGCKEKFSDYDTRKKGFMICTYGGKAKGCPDAKDLIPINMRDGSVLAVGKGNPEWNYSAPHGAGRIMSRTKAKNELSLEQYKKKWQGCIQLLLMKIHWTKHQWLIDNLIVLAAFLQVKIDDILVADATIQVQISA